MGSAMPKINVRANRGEHIMVGIMFVGLFGTNATTVIAGSEAMKHNKVLQQYGVTGHTDLFKENFLNVENMIFSGWDYYDTNVYERAKKYQIISEDIINQVSELKNIVAYKGIHTDKDIPLEEEFNYYWKPETIKEAINIIKRDIKDFKEKKHIDKLIVFYMGSPGKVVDRSILSMSYNEVIKLDINQLPSSVLYAIAAIESEVHFIDFTPSEALEFDFIYELAEEYHVQLSGRDGSTGQTMLKLVIANMLKIRNLHLDAWYSTNIIGNHDGYVLSMPEHCVTKIQDKTNGIKDLLGYDDFEHKVTIDYFKHKGDKKESWDAIYFSGWLNEPMSLRLNWQGEDAVLAAPIILDIVRLIELGSRHGLYGFQKQLGLFYKHPFMCEGMSFSQLYEQLIWFYARL